MLVCDNVLSKHVMVYYTENGRASDMSIMDDYKSPYYILTLSMFGICIDIPNESLH